MERSKIKLYLENYHYATLWLDEIKNMKPNGAYWYIEMKDGDIYEDCTNAVITNDINEKVGYFVK